MSTTIAVQRKSRLTVRPRAATLETVEQVKAVLEDLRAFLPVTLRQIYYQLVSGLKIENNLRSYQRLSRVLSMARIKGLIPWESIEDRTRNLLPSYGYRDKLHFVEEDAEDFLTGYNRDLLQTQEIRLELWIEKDALSHVAHRVAYQYRVPVIVAKGFSSVSYLHDFTERVMENVRSRKKTIMLYYGDHDPSGAECMEKAMKITLTKEMGLCDSWVEIQRCALTREQIATYNLPVDYKAVKKGDSRTRGFMEIPGNVAVELDALPVPVFMRLVQQSIEDHLNMDLFREEQELEDLEQADLERTKAKVQDYLNRELGLG